MELLRRRLTQRAESHGWARVSITRWRSARQTTKLWRQNSSADLRTDGARWSLTLGDGPETRAVVISTSRMGQEGARRFRTTGIRARLGACHRMASLTFYRGRLSTSCRLARERNG